MFIDYALGFSVQTLKMSRPTQDYREEKRFMSTQYDILLKPIKFDQLELIQLNSYLSDTIYKKNALRKVSSEHKLNLTLKCKRDYLIKENVLGLASKAKCKRFQLCAIIVCATSLILSINKCTLNKNSFEFTGMQQSDFKVHVTL